jgi:hypothetical protein
VVIVGIVFGTILTLAVFPGVLATAVRGWDPRPKLDEEYTSGPLPDAAE